MFERILVPLDGSKLAEGVLPHAVAVAQATGGQLTVVQVLETGGPSGEGSVTDPLDWHLRKAEATFYLQTVSDQLTGLDVAVETVLLEGQAAQQIVDFARNGDIDLIVLSSHGRGGLSRWNVSGAVQKVIFLAHTSVMLVRAYYPVDAEPGELHYRRILAPLDGSRRAEFVLPVVNTLARSEECERWFVTVVTRPEMPRLAPPAPEDAALADRVVARNREESEKYLARLEERLPGSQVRTLVGDDLVQTLHEFVDEQEIDLVVFNAHGFSGHNRRPYGGVVTNFIVYGHTPLLIVQDLPRGELAQSKAEALAAEGGQSDSGRGGRTIIHARTSE